MDAGDERRIREEIIIDRNTSDLIIGITQMFNTEQSYSAAMNGLLRMVSQVLHPDRIIVFERGEQATSCIFEWYAQGLEPQKDRLQNLSNAQFDAMRQLAEQKLELRQSQVLVSKVESLKSVDDGLHRTLEQEGVQQMMAVPLFNHGEIIGYLSVSNYELEEGLDIKRVLETVATFVSARIINQRLVDELARMGSHDRLTGLFNRWGIDAAVARAFERDPNSPYVLALVDIDDFKSVNDLYGHDVGDATLVTLSRRIEEAFSNNAIIGRNGGDEFLVMLLGDNVARADKLLGEFTAQEFFCELHGQRYHFSTSIGYVGYPEQVDNLHEAYAKADDALYAVKLAGKSGCARYTPAFRRLHRSQFGFTVRDVAENIPSSVVVFRMSDAHEIVFTNDELVKLLEYDNLADLMDCTGGSFERIIHPDDIAHALGVGSRSDSSFILTYRIVTKTGDAKRVVGMSRMANTSKVGPICYTFIVERP